jgi:5'-nucleotidase / UDP-sugar diphosphatase
MRAILRSCLALLIIAFAAVPLQAREVKVTFLVASDVYKLDGAGPRGGYARLNGVVSAERGRGAHVIYAFAGDLISPSLMSGFDQGEHTIALLNLVPPDVFVPGNHEFDFGPEVFFKRMGEAHFAKLAANLRDGKGAELPGFTDTKILEIDGVKIGVAGLITEETFTTARADAFVFTEAVGTGVATAKALRDAGADFVVAVGHTDRTQDRALFDTHAFDLILSGHDHDLMMQFDGRTAMAEPKEEAEYVMAVDVAFDVEEKDGKTTVKWWPEFRVIDTADVTPDPSSSARR